LSLGSGRAALQSVSSSSGLLSRFLQSLAASGDAELPWPGRAPEDFISLIGRDDHDRRLARDQLASWHRAAVLELPGPPLPFHPAAAIWGAVALVRAASLTVFRDLGAEDVERLIGAAELPSADLPEAHFSADLCLRHWPALTGMARRLSEHDPLIGAMHHIGRKAPLSAAGLNLPPPPAEHPVMTHPGLRQLLAERALEHHDQALLWHPAIAGLLREKLGAYAATLGRGLLPPVSAAPALLPSPSD